MVHLVRDSQSKLTFLTRSRETVNVDSSRDSCGHQTRLLVRRARAETDVGILDSTWVPFHEGVVELLPVTAFAALLESLLGEPAKDIRGNGWKTYFLTGSFLYSSDIYL